MWNRYFFRGDVVIDIEKLIIEKNYSFKEFKIIQKLKESKQSTKYHGEGSVYKHTELVCNEVNSLEEWKNLRGRERVVLYVSALFYDIGKLITAREEDGYIYSPNHAIKGANVFIDLAYKDYKIDRNIREEIAHLIKYHGLHLYFIERAEVDYDIIKDAEVTNRSFQVIVMMGLPLVGKDIYIKSNFRELK